MRLRFRACDSDWYFGSSSVLAEEGIDGFQQNRFPTGCHLRNLGIQPGRPVKIECLSIQTVIARHLDQRSGDKKVKRGKRQQTIVESKNTLQIGRHIWLRVRLRLFRLALAA